MTPADPITAQLRLVYKNRHPTRNAADKEFPDEILTACAWAEDRFKLLMRRIAALEGKQFTASTQHDSE